mmetsp:Transcript_35669/g.114062  ORF Transcript_35669/g.114062 Transcript_35669/m.114062 type:complete len:314 (-) Transcript_35669:594-1535(-)
MRPAQKRATSGWEVTTTTGMGHLYLAKRAAVAPVWAKTTMSLAPQVTAALTAAAVVASTMLKVLWALRSSSSSLTYAASKSYSSSASTEMRDMMATASLGHLPPADSPESMTASAPSRTAFATSEHSARVGRGFEIIDSSICVATTTGFPRRAQVEIIIFCARNTFSGGISMPKSPRATMMESHASQIASKLSRPSWFSIFDMILMWEPPASSRTLRMYSQSAADWTKLAATMSTFWGTPKSCKSLTSFGCNTGKSTWTPGKFMFFRSPMATVFITRHSTSPFSGAVPVTSNTKVPSATKIWLPAFTEVGSFS